MNKTHSLTLENLRWLGAGLLFAGLLLAGGLAGCGPTPTVTHQPVTLTVAVTEASAPLLDDLTEAYQAEYPYASFRLLAGDSPAGLAAVLAGQADLAAVAHVSTTETIWLTAVAIDNIVVVVHPSNPLKNLTVFQLRDIFRGRDSTWSEAGGLAEDIVVITRERGAEVRVDFEGRVLEGRPVTLNAIIAPSAQAVVDIVGNTPAAIGYVSMAHRPAGVKMMGVEGVLPTPLTAADRSYPLHRTLYFVASQEPQPGPRGHVRDFVAWVLGPAGQAVVGRHYGRVR